MNGSMRPAHKHCLPLLGALLVGLLAILSGPAQQVSALYPFKSIQNISHEITLTPDEWSSEFRCGLANAAELEQNGSLPLECLRDENYWIYKHIDEIHDQFKLLVRQDSLDERLADKIYMVNSHTGLDYHHYKFNTGNPARDKALEKYVAGSQVNDKLCKVHLKQMVTLLGDLSARVQRKRSGNNSEHETTKLDERHFRLGRILDSFGRYESGQLAGRYHSFGIYHECVRTPMLLVQGEGLVNSRYCWARLRLDEHLSAPLRERGIMNGTMQWGDFGFHLATCLPATCHTKSFSSDYENLRLVQQLVDSQYEMPDSMYVNQTLPVESIFCLVDMDSPVARMPPSGILLVTFLVGWCALCAIATYWRRHKHNLLSEPGASGRKLQKSFWSHLDLWDSFYEFLGERDVVREGARFVNLDTLNFIKCLCTLFVMIAHACLFTSPMSFTQLSMQALMEMGRLESFALFGFALVDTFFVISGLVISFVMLKRFARVELNQRRQALANQMLPATTSSKQNVLDFVKFEREFYTPLGAGFYKYWFLMTAGRYLRLVPLFLLAFWFKKGLFVWLGSGPMWDYGLNRNTNVGGCQQESWLTPFTPLSAYLPVARQCVPQSWSISNDLALSLFIPPVTILLFKRPRMAYLYAFVAYALAIYFGFAIYYGLDARLRFMMEQMRNHSVIVLFQMASHAYSAPCYRVPSILCGVLAGRALFVWEQKWQQSAHDSETTPPKRRHTWPWWFRWLATPLGLGYIGFVMTSSFFAAEVRISATEQTRRFMPFYMLALHHSLWSLANAIVLLRMVSDWRDGFTMRVFASRFFKCASKLSYAFLLLHLDILLFDALIEPQATEYSRWNYFKSLGTTIVYSILLAVPVHVILEHPIDKLTKTYLLPT